MKIVFAKVLIGMLLAVVVYLYADIVTWSVGSAEAIALSEMPRPYVYRTLMPWLARGLVALGVRADVAVLSLIFCAAIGLVYAIKFLSDSFKHE